MKMTPRRVISWMTSWPQFLQNLDEVVNMFDSRHLEFVNLGTVIEVEKHIVLFGSSLVLGSWPSKPSISSKEPGIIL